MCGIAGILYRNKERSIDRSIIENMSAKLSHRGPDGDGIYFNKSISLIHRRLAVIGLTTGHQPMQEKNKALVFNGEIYNYKDLKNKYKTRYSFRTESDTEVILASLFVGSNGWINELIGMFAFAIWDDSKRELVLTRDRFGKKPLYYYKSSDMFIFASEIKCILEHPNVTAEPNISKYGEFLAFRSVAGNETLFKNIYEVPPGSTISINQNEWTFQTNTFWTDSRNQTDYFPELENMAVIEQLDYVLRDSIKYRLVSDVPVGSFNSGGVDSSIVSALATEELGRSMHTFSVGFTEPEYDESEYAALIANKIRSTHHKLVITQEDYINNFDKTLWYLEEPLNHAHTVPLFMLSKIAKEYVTVVLSGEGADEVFGGYPRHQIPLLSSFLMLFPKILRMQISTLLRSSNPRVSKLFGSGASFDQSVVSAMQYIPELGKNCLLSDELVLDMRNSLMTDCKREFTGRLNKVLCYDRKTYLPPLLNRLDKITMAHGLEARTPFLDHRLVSWANNLPNKYRIKLGKDNKVILKQFARQHIPSKAIDRRKSGFGVPLDKWFKDKSGMGRYLQVVTDKTFRERGLYNVTCVEKLIKEHLAGAHDNSELLWSIVSLELWHRKNFSQA